VGLDAVELIADSGTRRRRSARAVAAVAVTLVSLAPLGCATRSNGSAADTNGTTTTITFAGSAVGAEGEVLARQVARFERDAPGIRVRIQRTPDDATQRHQLFVQWLNAHVGQPDVLQLDVVWTAEFAAAGWILPLTRFHADVSDVFPGVLAANVWRDTLYALPWWTDVGMLYWRTDLFSRAPATLEEMRADLLAAHARAGGPRDGLAWQGARYEGLVTVFLEFLGAYGGRILDDDGRVAVDDSAGVAALTFMRDLVRDGLVPRAAMTWHEEEARLAFQRGDAALMRNWPYAYPLMNDSSQSRIAGRFAVAPMPAAGGWAGGAPTAALGGQELAINGRSAHPDAAFRLIAYLTAPEQMLERARIAGTFPPRRSLYDSRALDSALAIPAAAARAILEHATARPVTPVYSELSDLLQVQLHRALTGQAEPAAALHAAARQIDALLVRTRVRALVAR
jgi:multiple sugar transport system substrate-binding protein